jgi:cell division protein DivIC
MMKIPSHLKNKYGLTLFVFLIYVLFLDDLDVFSIISQKQKLNKLEIQRDNMKIQLISTRSTLRKLNKINYLEAFARSEKFFKKENEEIFIITYKSNFK